MKRLKQNGFTLLEMILVLIIISSIIVVIMGYVTQRGTEFRRDRTVLQFQQILNAGLAYYLNFSKWPENIPTDLQENGYLPKNIVITNSWGKEYFVSVAPNKQSFSVCTTIVGSAPPVVSGLQQSTYSTTATAEVIAGRLPLAYAVEGEVTDNVCPEEGAPCTGGLCTVVAIVNIPGQNLNNARSVNFTGVYHNGGCVPVPECPTTGSTQMEPSIIVAPVSVSGLFDTNNNVVPISSFTASATPKSTRPYTCTTKDSTNPTAADCELPTNTTASPTGEYWRVCLDVVTEKGRITTSGNVNWTKESGSIMAMTRCVPKGGSGEPSGSDFDVFENR